MADYNLYGVDQKTATNGSPIRFNRKVVEVAVSDTNGSIYRLAKVNSNAIIKSIKISNDIITLGSDYSVGLYQVGDNGNVINADIFSGTLDLTSAGTDTDAFANVDIAHQGREIWEHIGGAKDLNNSYVIALTANTVGSSGGTILVDIEYLNI